MISDLQVAEDACSATDPAVTAEPCAARNTYACGYCRMRTYPDIMGNLNQVINLCTILDNRIFYGASINGRIGTNFNITEETPTN